MSSTTTTTATKVSSQVHADDNSGGGVLHLASSTTTTKSNDPDTRFSHLLPSFDESTKYPPLTDFEHVDPGHAALKLSNPLSFLNGAQVSDLTPEFGSEVLGGAVQLAHLDAAGRQQLALFVAQRGVVAFRDQQSFLDADPDWLVDDWTSFYGRPHIHPTSAHPKDRPYFHLVYRDDRPKPGSEEGTTSFNYEPDSRLTSAVWHSDVTYERQPPGLTVLYMLDSPSTGGDTAYASQVEAYNRLSPSFAAYLETLSAVHSGVAQADYSRRSGKRGGVVRREPVENVHPVVRVHPVTGEKALFVNRQFTTRIVGLKQPESDAILNLLYDHLEKGIDFQVRVRHQPGTVVVWDNRVTAHSAIVDYAGQGTRRWGARLTPQAEKPLSVDEWQTKQGEQRSA